MKIVIKRVQRFGLHEVLQNMRNFRAKGVKMISKTCLIVIIVFSAGMAQAQSVKFAHIDQQALITAMPEFVEAQKSLEDYAKGLEDQLGSLQKEFSTKLNEFQEQSASMSEVVRDSKQEELSVLNQRIQNFSNSADQKLQQKQYDMLQPILEKANKAIEEVAKQQGVIYVFDVNTVLFKSSASIDILAAVKTKLGIK